MVRLLAEFEPVEISPSSYSLTRQTKLLRFIKLHLPTNPATVAICQPGAKRKFSTPTSVNDCPSDESPPNLEILGLMR